MPKLNPATAYFDARPDRGSNVPWNERVELFMPIDLERRYNRVWDEETSGYPYNTYVPVTNGKRGKVLVANITTRPDWVESDVELLREVVANPLRNKVRRVADFQPHGIIVRLVAPAELNAAPAEIPAFVAQHAAERGSLWLNDTLEQVNLAMNFQMTIQAAIRAEGPRTKYGRWARETYRLDPSMSLWACRARPGSPRPDVETLAS